MTKTRIFFLAVFVVLFACVSTKAGDFAILNFIGFSKDGKYLAFEEYGTQDGSGFPYSSIYVVDVAKNAFAAPSVNVRLENESATEAQARARAKARAATALSKFRILQRNTGTLIVSRILTDVAVNNFLSDEASKTQTVNFAEIILSMYREGDYDLVLKPVEVVKTKDCDYADQPIYKFELSLKDKQANRTIVLQKDDKLPTSRSCPLDYSIQYVYIYKDRIAVFLNTYYTGFEGRDMRYLAVTGTYK